MHGLNVEIQETIAAGQVNTFTEPLEKAQRIENVKAHVRAFQVQKRSAPSSNAEESRENGLPPKVTRDARKVNLPTYPPWILGKLEGLSTRGVQVGKGRKERIPREGQIVAPCLACGYCGKTNHTENDCWVKRQKCLIYESVGHQINNYPRK